jgi:hypothetical protein
MWSQLLLDRFESGFALPNAIREALPAGVAGRLGAGATLVMAALSMPDLAPRRTATPFRLDASRIAIGGAVLRVQDCPPNALSVRVDADLTSSSQADTFDLANFVGQVMMLRACGDEKHIADWLRSKLV